jgi:2-polyprenyl-3-methyl-5-hydroxy-6-metoxy-1,4-benzoquinol methylase
VVSGGQSKFLFEPDRIFYLSNTDKDWERIAQSEPYYGVLTNYQFLAANLDKNAEKKFWQSGERHIDKVFTHIEKHLRVGFFPKNTLDFGCGVGRLLKPLAQRSKMVTGVDVSATMLKLAAKNVAEDGGGHIRLSSGLQGYQPASFDFIHSYIVFQHIPVSRGYELLEELLLLLKSGGIGVLHFTYDNYSRKSWLKKIQDWPFAKQVGNLLQKKAINEPVMQMNEYDLDNIFTRLSSNGCENLFIDFTDHGVKGAILYFQKGQA